MLQKRAEQGRCPAMGGRFTSVRCAEDGQLEVGGNGVALRAPRAGAHGVARRRGRRSAARHKRGTAGGAGDTKKALRFLVTP